MHQAIIKAKLTVMIDNMPALSRVGVRPAARSDDLQRRQPESHGVRHWLGSVGHVGEHVGADVESRPLLCRSRARLWVIVDSLPGPTEFDKEIWFEEHSGGKSFVQLLSLYIEKGVVMGHERLEVWILSCCRKRV